MAFADGTPDALFKVLILGDSSVGKSCILMQFVEGTFQNTGKATIGVGYGAKTMNLCGRLVKLQIWDTVTVTQAGQESYRSITRSFYKNTNAAMLVYDVTRERSFNSLQSWLSELRSHVQSSLPLYLVGNMIDLSQHREVPTDTAQAFSDSSGLNGFLEVSAKTGENISKVSD
jgi:small GTP-binding protein